MRSISVDDCLNARVHVGHISRRWNPRMKQYILLEQNHRHVIDVRKTVSAIESSYKQLSEIVASGQRVLFVATKKQFSDYVSKVASEVDMPYVTDRWLGGMLTNFVTIRRVVKKSGYLQKRIEDPQFCYLAKKEQAVLKRRKEKDDRKFCGIGNMFRLPGAVFVVDVKNEKTAVSEARGVGIPVFGIVDTDSDPTCVDFPIPANDDALESVTFIIDVLKDAIYEGMAIYNESLKSAEGVHDSTDGTGNMTKNVSDRPKGSLQRENGGTNRSSRRVAYIKRGRSSTVGDK